SARRPMGSSPLFAAVLPRPLIKEHGPGSSPTGAVAFPGMRRRRSHGMIARSFATFPPSMPETASADPTSRAFSGRELACRRGERLVFSGLSFALPPGGALVLTGPNGSGKSSLLRLMAGLIRPDAGALSWDGIPVSNDPVAHRARLHFIGHQDAVKP